jgi:hypothetical protein
MFGTPPARPAVRPSPYQFAVGERVGYDVGSYRLHEAVLQQPQADAADAAPREPSKPLELYQRIPLVIDSRNRNDPDLTTPSEYVVEFPTIKNIKMIRLVSTEVTNSAYVVNDTNHWMDFYDDVAGVYYPIELTNGTYTGTELANEITRAISVAMGVPFGTVILCTYITFEQKIQIDRVDVIGNRFSIIWTGTPIVPLPPGVTLHPDTNMYQLLGYDYTDVSNVTTTKGTNVINLAGENYIYLCIKEFRKAIVTSDNVDSILAKVILNVPPKSVCFNSFVTTDIVYREPLSFLNRLQVSFRRHDGTLVDFNNVDNSFSLEVFTL